MPSSDSRGRGTEELRRHGEQNHTEARRVDLLAFGPHPDDIEIGLAGTIARHVSEGYRVGLCDLTRGELGSNGTPEERAAEAEEARVVLGADWRVNLGWPDGRIAGSDDEIRQVVGLLRRCRPRTVAVPYWGDRHPDHRAASDVLTRAVFMGGLARFAPGVPGPDGPAWRADWICYYFINDAVTPSFAVDVSAHYDRSGRRSPAIAPSSRRDRPSGSRRA
jgi:N-acetylglucosamine malate deacetylase 1